MRNFFFTLLLAWVLPGAGVAQNCYCDNCPASLTDADTTFFTIQIVGAANNDLSDPSQGICGFCLDFSHQYLGDLLVQLVSPVGQVVTLMGPVDLNSGFTSFTNWDVCFVPCTNVAFPDPGFSAIWNNDQPWGFFGGYNGSYYPYAGCLEDFNTGPVDGIWTLMVIDQVGLSTGTMLDYSITFCDDTNLECISCEASAGEIPAGQFTSCAGDSLWNLDLVPVFPGLSNPADPTLFAYSFLVAKNDTLMALLDTPDLRSFPPGNYTICGLSYAREDSSLIPPFLGNILLSTLRDSLVTVDAPFCGRTTLSCVEATILSDPIVFLRWDTICPGEALIIGLDTLTDSGQYDLLDSVPGGCDTLVQVDLHVRPSQDSFLFASICAGDILVYSDDTLSLPGTYPYHFSDRFGCDSTVFLTLEVLFPKAQISVEGILDCVTDEVHLDGSSSSSDPTVMYQWFYENGNGLPNGAGSDIIVSQPGLYSLVVSEMGSYDSLVCADTAFAVVEIDTASPLAAILGSSVLTCLEPVSTLIQDSTLLVPGLQYQWTGPNAFFETTPVVAVNMPGVYVLQVTNPGNGCSDANSLEITLDTLPPSLFLTGGLLTCTDTLVWAIAQTDATPNEVVWSGPGIFPSFQGDSLEVNLPGLYSAVATAQNGCTTQADLVINEEVIAPVFEIAGDSVLTCTDSVLLLESTGGVEGLPHRWVDPDGVFSFGESISVGLPGQYLLEVTGLNGCTGSDLFLVLQDTAKPVAMLANDTLTCASNSASLQVEPTEASWSYAWSGPDNFAATTANVVVGVGGMYSVEVRGENGCISMLQAEVAWDTLAPHGGIVGLDTLNCSTTVVLLEYGGVDSTEVLRWLWLDSLGDTLSQTSSALITDPGLVIVQAQNENNGCIQADTALIALDTVPPVSDAGSNQILNCASPLAMLDGGNSAGSGPLQFVWFGPQGVPIDSSSVSIGTTPGWYVLQVTQENNGCSAIDSLLLVADANLPTAIVQNPGVLTCFKQEVILNGSLSSSGPEFRYQWLSPDSTLLDTVPIITVSEPGDYIFSVENIQNGCTGYYTVSVLANNQPLPLDIVAPQEVLTCSVTDIRLEANFPDPGAPLVFSWQTLAGNLLGQQDTLLVSNPGFFKAELINLQTGCISRDTLEITQSKIFPTASLNSPDTLNCARTEIWLDGSASQPMDSIAFQWLNPFGNVVGTSDSLLINKPGNYTLVVRETTTDCTDSITKFIIQDVQEVTLQVNPQNPLLTCGIPELNLVAQATGGGPDYVYTWFNSSGSVIGNLSSISIDTPEEIIVMVTSLRNGCSDEEMIEIIQNVELPTLEPLQDTVFSCFNSEITVAGKGVTASGQGVYTWYDPNGNNLSNDSVLTIFSPGLYVLKFMDPENECFQTDTFEIFANQESPLAVGKASGVFTCLQDSILLDASGSVAVTGLYEPAWYLDSVLVSTDMEVFVTVPGLYELVITDALNGCFSIFPLEVGADTLPPVIVPLPDVQLNCVTDSVTLDPLPDSAGLYQMSWSSSSGLYTGNEPLVTVGQEEEIYLQVLDPENGCFQLDTCLITIDTLAPVSQPYSSGILTCTDSLVVLNAGDDVQPDWQYEWLNASGSLLAQNENAVVGMPGQFFLNLVDTSNQCTYNANLEVVQEIDPPSLVVGPIDTITCQNLTVKLDASASAPSNLLEFTWSSVNGNYLSQTNQIMVDSAGLYVVQVSRIDNGCTRYDTLTVYADQQPPLFEFQQPDTLDCNQQTINLIAVPDDSTLSTESLWIAGETGDTLGSMPVLTVQQAGTFIYALENTSNKCQSTDTLTVVSDSSGYPSYQLLFDSLLTCFLTEATFVVEPAPDQPALVVTWLYEGSTPVGNDLALQTDVPGSYLLIAEQSVSGCQDTLDLELFEDLEQPQALADDPDTLSCNQGSILLDGSASSPSNELLFSWFDENLNKLTTEPQFLTSLAGTYYLTVVDSVNGCGDTLTVEVVSVGTPPIAQASVADTINCEQTFVLLTNQGSDTGHHIQGWYGPGGFLGSSDTIAVAVGGFYVLEILDTLNGCQAQDSVWVVQDTVAPEAIILADGGGIITCTSDQIIIDGSASVPIGSLAYSWLDDTGDLIATAPQTVVTVEGVYTLVATHTGNHCRDTQAVEIGLDTLTPTIALNHPDTLDCKVEEVTLEAFGSGSNYQYMWVGPGLITSGNFSFVQATFPGTYQVTVTDTLNGCQWSGNFSVVQDTSLPRLNLIPPDVTNCRDTQVVLDAGASLPAGSLSYEWTTTDGNIFEGGEAAVAMVSPGAVYHLLLTDTNNGCVRDTFVTVPNIPKPPNGYYSFKNPTCYANRDGLIRLDSISGGQSPFRTALDDGLFVGGLPVFGNLSAGSYELTLEDSRGCRSIEVINLVQPDLLVVELGDERYIELGTPVELKGQVNRPLQALEEIYWDSPVDQGCEEPLQPSCLEITVMPAENTIYEIEVIDTNGCMARANVLIRVNRQLPVFVPNAFSPDGDGWNDWFTLFADTGIQNINRLVVYDRWGEKIFERLNFQPNDYQSGWNGLIRGQPAPPGVYVYWFEILRADGRIDVLKGNVTLVR